MFDKLFRRGPSEFPVHLGPQGPTLTVSKDESILQAALRAQQPFPHNCRVGGCGQCKCRLVSGKVKEMTDKSYLLSAEELQAGFILACQSRPLSEVVVEVPAAALAAMQAASQAPAEQGWPAEIRTAGSIEGLTPLTHDILHVVLALDDPLTFRAGQHMAVQLPDGQGERCYSLATAPDVGNPRQAEFFIRRVPGGVFTEWLFTQACLGDMLKLSGPRGQFGLGPAPADGLTEGAMVCVAGGSGLAPVLSILQQAVAEGRHHRPLWLLLGARTQADVYGQASLDALARVWAGPVHRQVVLSNEPEGSGWSGARGLVSEAVPAAVAQAMAHTVSASAPVQAWLCGPPPMIDACTLALRQAGVGAEHIHEDRFLDASHTRRAA